MLMNMSKKTWSKKLIFNSKILATTLAVLGILTTVHVIPLQAEDFTVISLSDPGIGAVTNGVCDEPCTLRDAINEANALAGSDTIYLPEESINVLQFELSVTDDLSLVGSGQNSATIQANEDSEIGIPFPPRLLNISNSARIFINDVNLFGVGELQMNTEDNGGCIYGGTDSFINLNNVHLENCIAAVSGGAIYSDSGSMVAWNTNFHNNHAPNGGAIYTVNAPALTTVILGSSFSSNTGRAILLSNSGISVYSSTFSKNDTAFSWGVTSSLSLSHVTIAEHTGTSLLNFGPVTVDHTIIDGTCQNATVNSEGYNIETGNTCGLMGAGDQINTNPLLGDFVTEGGYYPLLANSPAIDAGNPESTVEEDQLGLTRRPIDGNEDGDARVDIGAIEYQAGAEENTGASGSGGGSGGGEGGGGGCSLGMTGSSSASFVTIIGSVFVLITFRRLKKKH